MKVSQHALLHYDHSYVMHSKRNPLTYPLIIRVCVQSMFSSRRFVPLFPEKLAKENHRSYEKREFSGRAGKLENSRWRKSQIRTWIIIFSPPWKNSTRRTTRKPSAGISRSFRRKRDLQILAGLMWYQLVCSLGGVLKGVRENSPPVLPKRFHDDLD